MILENNGFKVIVGKDVPEGDRPETPKEEDKNQLLYNICELIREGGYDPISQLVGFIISDDPTHISSYKNARVMMNRIDRDEMLSDMVKAYLKKLEDKYSEGTDYD